MLLTFSKDTFKDQIKAGQKIHTIRVDKSKRWKPGMKIHFWSGNPRNVKANPYPFGEDKCVSVQEIKIVRSPYIDRTAVQVWVDNKQLSEEEKIQLAQNDGLTLEQFRLWFVPPAYPEFSGRIIHWTDKKY